MVDKWENPKFKKEPKVPEMEQDDSMITDEDIEAFQPVANELQEESAEVQKDKVKKVIATRDRIMAQRDRPFDLELDVGDEILVFKVRRMSEKERVKYNKLNFTKFSTNFEDLTPEEIEQITEQGYIMMAQLIVEPKLTVDEWKELTDTALLNQLSTKVSLLSTELNDAVLINEFKKK